MARISERKTRRDLPYFADGIYWKNKHEFKEKKKSSEDWKFERLGMMRKTLVSEKRPRRIWRWLNGWGV